MCCRDNLKAVRGEREGEKTDERNSDCGFLDCGFLSDLGQSHPLLGKSHERERESARRREEGLFYGPIAEREEWLERDEGGGTQTEEGWSHSEEGREREKGGDFILQQYIGRDARNLSSIKVCIQREERDASVYGIHRAFKAQPQSSLLLNVFCSGHLAPLHTVQTLWKVSRLTWVLRCSASVKMNNSACACEIMTAVKNLSQSISLLLPRVLFCTDIDDCLACAIAKNTLPRCNLSHQAFNTLYWRRWQGEGN